MIWKPDTCLCEIEFEDWTDEGVFITRCDLHAESKLNEVMAHNQSFNLVQDQTEAQIAAKKKESVGKCLIILKNPSELQ